MPAKRQFQVNTKLDCEDMCLAEKKFVCKSATYNYENRVCKLYDENRRTKPAVFKATRMKVDYLENQCVKGKQEQQSIDKLVKVHFNHFVSVP